jgi:hypothetical protein
MNTSVRKDNAFLGGKVIPAHFVHMVSASPPVSPLPPGEGLAVKGSHEEPKVTLIKEGDTVKAIEIHCTCGAVVRLDCEY